MKEKKRELRRIGDLRQKRRKNRRKFRKKWGRTQIGEALRLLTGEVKAGEVVRQEIHILHLETAAVEVLQRSGVGGKAELQAVGVQSLAVAAVFPVFPLAAVLTVAQQGVAGGGKLGADLMGAPGDQVALHQGQSVLYRQSLI